MPYKDDFEVNANVRLPITHNIYFEDNLEFLWWNKNPSRNFFSKKLSVFYRIHLTSNEVQS